MTNEVLRITMAIVVTSALIATLIILYVKYKYIHPIGEI